MSILVLLAGNCNSRGGGLMGDFEVSEKLLGVVRRFVPRINAAKLRLDSDGVCCGGKLYADVNIDFSAADYGVDEGCFTQAIVQCDFFRYCLFIIDGGCVILRLTGKVDHSEVLGEWSFEDGQLSDGAAIDVIKTVVAKALKLRSD